MTEEKDYLENKKEDKTYLTKSFPYKDFSSKEMKSGRYVKKTFSMQDFVEFVREKDSVLMYETPTQKQQITAFVDEDTKKAHFTLQRYTKSTDSPHMWQFSFGINQLHKINKFVESLPYLDYSIKKKYSITDRDLHKRIKKLKSLEIAFEDLSENDLRQILSSEKLEGRDFVNLAFRNKGLEVFEKLLTDQDYFEKIKQEKDIKYDEMVWQSFFEKHDWIFGHGLDYRFMTIFDREMSVGDGGTEDRNKPKVDFLNELSDFTVLVEVKTPNSKFFKNSKNRSGVWSFHSDLIDSYSQVLEQKAEWTIKGDKGNNLNKEGSKKITRRTRDPKTILLIGNKKNTNSRD